MAAGSDENTRSELFQEARKLNLDDARRLLEFQLRLADAIAEAESRTRAAGEFDRHTFLLRRCGDSLVFRLLVPHAIRQLLGTASPRAHSVSGQGEAFRATRETAERYASDGHAVLLADISHVVRVGDVIVCDNPFVPSVIEVKAGRVAPQHVRQGRRGRQVSRSLGTIEYLKSDYAHIFGQPMPKIAVQSKESMQFGWKAVNDVALNAMRDGVAVVRVSEHDVILAVHAVDGRPVDVEPIVGDLERMRSPLMASHAVGLLNPELLSRPPLIWPIDDAPTIPLMEEQLILVHAIDLARFTDPLEEGFRVREVSHDRGFSTERNGEHGTASTRWIDDVMFGYATIESAVAALREMHDLTKAALDGLDREPPSIHPEAAQVESHELSFFEQPAVVLETKDARYKIDVQPRQKPTLERGGEESNLP